MFMEENHFNTEENVPILEESTPLMVEPNIGETTPVVEEANPFVETSIPPVEEPNIPWPEETVKEPEPTSFVEETNPFVETSIPPVGEPNIPWPEETVKEPEKTLPIEKKDPLVEVSVPTVEEPNIPWSADNTKEPEQTQSVEPTPAPVEGTTIPKKNNSNQKRTLIIIVVLILLVIVLGSAFFFFANKKEGSRNNKKEKDSLSEEFQKNLLENLTDYIDENYEFKGKMSTKELVSASEFDNCSGTIEAKELSTGYKYTINYRCKKSSPREIIYYFYDSGDEDEEYDNTFVVGDAIFISTTTDEEYKRQDDRYQIVTSNSLVFHVFDTKGNHLWTASYKNAKQDTNKSSVKYVQDVKKIGTNYYVFVTNNYLVEETANWKTDQYLLTYDKKGKLIKEEKLPDDIGDVEYIGEWKGNYYYVANTGYATLTHNILVLQKDGTYIYTSVDEYELDDSIFYDYSMGINKGNIYAIYDDYTFDETVLVKANLQGEKISSKTILNSEKYTNNGSILATDNYIFIQYYATDDEKENPDIYIRRYNTDLNVSNPKYDYRKDVLKKFEDMYGKELTNDYYEVEMFVDHNMLNVLLCTVEDEDLCYLVTTNEELEVMNMESIMGQGLPNYSASLMEERVLKDNTVLTVSAYGDTTFILGFYK